jgi:hypothetical protein
VEREETESAEKEWPSSVMALPPLEKRAREPSALPYSPPMCRSWEEGEDRAGTDGRAKLGDGFVTPVGAGEGAIDPTERADGGSGARAMGMEAHDDAGPPFC